MDDDKSQLEAMGRMEGETGRAWLALVEYARMGVNKGIRATDARQTRSIRELAKVSRHTFRTLGRWSSQFKWVERVELYDRALAEMRAKVWEARRLAVDEQDWLEGEAMRAVGRMQLIQDRMRLEQGMPLPAGEGRQYTKDGSKLQRLAVGSPTERIETQLPDNVVEAIRKAGYVKSDTATD